MSHKSRMLLFIGLIALSQHLLTSQENQQYLQKVGLVDSLYSSVLNESRTIFVQRPASYDTDSKRKYPVTYILDGEVLLPTVNNVHEFYYDGFIPEMILVGISNSFNRTRDLTTSVVKSNQGMQPNEANGQAPVFFKFLQEELIPYVEENYRVTNFRTLIGHSYGGLFTIYSLINHPDVFDNYLAIDPSLDWDNQQLIQQSKQVLNTHEFKGKSLFISMSGQLHMQDPQVTIDNVREDTSEFTLFSRSIMMLTDLVQEQAQSGIQFEWQFYPQELHGTVPLPSIKDGLLSLFEWFQMENTDKFNAPETPKDELYRIVKYRANKLHNHFGYEVAPYPEELLNVLGYMSLDRNQAEKAKMFFEFAIDYYPQSANGYDAMADYYVALKDHGRALKMVTKAYEISGSDYHQQRIQELKEK